MLLNTTKLLANNYFPEHLFPQIQSYNRQKPLGHRLHPKQMRPKRQPTASSCATSGIQARENFPCFNHKRLLTCVFRLSHYINILMTLLLFPSCKNILTPRLVFALVDCLWTGKLNNCFGVALFISQFGGGITCSINLRALPN